MRYWYYRVEGSVYANGPIKLDESLEESDVIEYVDALLPEGSVFDVWSSTPWWL